VIPHTGPISHGPFRHREHHRDVQGGTIRAAIFGVSDGLVTNASLILGVAGADADAGTVRLAGLAGLIAGAISMAAGEFVSMSAQT
jgi:VIT1/CCC1 family predicted Fe2+/Mn2+ transporter